MYNKKTTNMPYWYPDKNTRPAEMLQDLKNRVQRETEKHNQKNVANST
jgi:hypothetical protein